MRTPNSGPNKAKEFYYCLYNSPLGRFGLVASSRGLCEIRTQPGTTREFKQYLKTAYPTEPTEAEEILRPAITQLDEYFQGKRKHFTCKLDLDQGTAFQQKVWKALQTIPFGETQSYSGIARAIGNQKAIRAVGSANGKNPIPIIVPCHRVIRKSGDLGGYTGGLDKKKFLLQLEGI